MRENTIFVAMSKKKSNIHDTYVKETFSDRDRAVEFFGAFLPQEILDAIDLQSLVVTKESYINGDLIEHFSDLVFEVDVIAKDDHQSYITKANISLLFEHKSSPDKNVIFQIGHYIFSQWIKLLKNKEPLKPIIPVIYYQGKRQWIIPSISDIFEPYPESILSLMPKIPNIYIPLRDIKEDTIIQLRNSMLAAALMAQRTIIDPIKISEDILKIFSLFPPESNYWNFLELTIVYIQKQVDIEPNKLIDAIQDIPEDLKNIIMTTYDKFIQKGEQIGAKKINTKIILNSFDLGMEINLIANITDIKEADIRIILEQNGRI